MATSLFPTPVPRRKYPVEFKAGLLKRDDGTNWLKPDERRGLIYMDQTEDGLMHFYWKDRKTGNVEIDLIIFQDEAEFIRVEQATTGRVYLLNFKSSNQKLFFWMQDGKDEKDEENVRKVNRMLNDQQSGGSSSSSSSVVNVNPLNGSFRTMDDVGGGFGMDQEQLFQLLQSHGTFGTNFPSSSNISAGEPQQTATSGTDTGAREQINSVINTDVRTTNATTGSTPFTDEQLGNLRDILAGIQVPRGEIRGHGNDISLNDVLTPTALRPILNNPDIASALFPHLPQNTAVTTEELLEVIHSPQFNQALASLSYALQSGQLGPVVSQLGIDPSASNSVESFLYAIEEQARRQPPQDDNLDDQNPDRMDED